MELDKKLIGHEFKPFTATVEAGKIKPILFKTFPLRDAAGAHAELERADHVGKVMMTV